MFIPLELVEFLGKDLFLHVQENFPMIPKNLRFHFIVSQRSVCKHCLIIEVVEWPVIDSLTVLHKLPYVCTLVDDPCAKICMLKMDVFEGPKSSCSFAAVTELGLATHISMVHNEKPVHNYNNDDNK